MKGHANETIPCVMADCQMATPWLESQPNVTAALNSVSMLTPRLFCPWCNVAVTFAEAGAHVMSRDHMLALSRHGAEMEQNGNYRCGLCDVVMPANADIVAFHVCSPAHKAQLGAGSSLPVRPRP